MKEFIEKLIGRLMKDKRIGRMSFEATVEIVNQLAKEYKGNLSENLTSSETVITNANKIRAMTDEELAEFLDCTVKSAAENLFSCDKRECDECDKCYLEWLQSEAE